jgi:hypothetical protein
MLLPRKTDYWIAAKAPNLYTLLWFWGMVRNEPPEESKEMIRFNAEIVTTSTGEEHQENYLTLSQVMMLLREMKEGDALVINAVAETEGGL